MLRTAARSSGWRSRFGSNSRPMVELIETALTLSAGAGLGLLVERLKWHREDTLRWVAERQRAYREFLSALDRWEELDFEAAAGGETERWFEAPPEDRMEPLLGVQVSQRLRPRANAAAATCQDALAEIGLIGSRTVFRRAESAVARMRLLSAVRLDSPPCRCGGATDEHEEAQVMYQLRRDQFVTAVRQDLRVA